MRDLHQFVGAVGQFGVDGADVVVLVDRLAAGRRSSAPKVLAGSVLRWKARTSCQTRAGSGSSHMLDRSVADRTTVRGGDVAACPSVNALHQATPVAVEESAHPPGCVSFQLGEGGCRSLVASGWPDVKSYAYAVVLATAGSVPCAGLPVVTT